MDQLDEFDPFFTTTTFTTTTFHLPRVNSATYGCEEDSLAEMSQA
jgi:hypothetical protein